MARYAEFSFQDICIRRKTHPSHGDFYFVHLLRARLRRLFFVLYIIYSVYNFSKLIRRTRRGPCQVFVFLVCL